MRARGARGRLGWALSATLLAAPAAAPPVTVVPADQRTTQLAPAVRRAIGIAADHFGPACPGGVVVAVRRFDARVPGFPRMRRLGRAYRRRCRIELNVEVYGWRRGASRPLLCTLVVHEYGHLAGQGHSPHPRDVMHPRIIRVHPPCR